MSGGAIPRWLVPWRELGAVAVGGAVGTALRVGVDAVIPHGDDGFPASTLVVNVIGALVLGFVVARLWPRVPPWMRAGFGTGLLGSFTTFSALAIAMVTLVDVSQWMTAVLYLAASLVLGLGAAALGLRSGAGGSARLGRSPNPIDEVDE